MIDYVGDIRSILISDIASVDYEYKGILNSLIESILSILTAEMAAMQAINILDIDEGLNAPIVNNKTKILCEFIGKIYSETAHYKSYLKEFKDDFKSKAIAAFMCINGIVIYTIELFLLYFDLIEEKGANIYDEINKLYEELINKCGKYFTTKRTPYTGNYSPMVQCDIIKAIEFSDEKCFKAYTPKDPKCKEQLDIICAANDILLIIASLDIKEKPKYDFEGQIYLSHMADLLGMIRKTIMDRYAEFNLFIAYCQDANDIVDISIAMTINRISAKIGMYMFEMDSIFYTFDKEKNKQHLLGRIIIINTILSIIEQIFLLVDLME